MNSPCQNDILLLNLYWSQYGVENRLFSGFILVTLCYAVMVVGGTFLEQPINTRWAKTPSIPSEARLIIG